MNDVKRMDILKLVAVLSFWAIPTWAQTTHNVELDGIEFVEADITIDVGDTVQWEWVSGFHNVESGVIDGLFGNPDGNFRSGDPTLVVGTTFDRLFDQTFLDANVMPGDVYPYYCFVHTNVGMAGTITVVQGGCTFDSDCDDDLFCTGAEACVGGSCQAGTAPDCDDDVGCTDDSCNAGTDSCENIAVDDNCQNGVFCDGAETCDAALGCQAGSDPCPGQNCAESTDS
ncbi:MAG: hypothetical protein IH987_13050, partial [Planctomycetes bacterium]|nr:hypothetical protein [Planctomycetota bacterium]